MPLVVDVGGRPRHTASAAPPVTTDDPVLNKMQRQELSSLPAPLLQSPTPVAPVGASAPVAAEGFWGS